MAAALAAEPGAAAVQAVGAEWFERYCRMVAYMHANGNVLPTHRYKIPEGAPGGGFALGAWVSQQRHGTSMTDARRVVLDATEGWAWARPRADLEAHWDAMLARAVCYFVENGAWPPSSMDPIDGLRLGSWIVTQRQRYKGNVEGQSLSPAHLAKLEATPGWLWEARAVVPVADREAHWDTMLAKAVCYFVDKGEWPPTGCKDPVDGSHVGHWVIAQRQQYKLKGKKGAPQMSPARIAKLEATPGWLWDAKAGPTAEQEAHWGTMLAKAVRYFVDEGEWPPASYKDPADGGTVGSWVSHQRQQYKGADPSRLLSSARLAKLEATPGWTWEAAPRRSAARVVPRVHAIAETIRSPASAPRRSAAREEAHVLAIAKNVYSLTAVDVTVPDDMPLIAAKPVGRQAPPSSAGQDYVLKELYHTMRLVRAPPRQLIFNHKLGRRRPQQVPMECF